MILVGKAGVGDAIDSHNLNSTYFESHGVKVLGAIFNKQSLDGFYSLDACKESITSYFDQYKSYQKSYGFIPLLSLKTAEGESELSLQLALENAVTDAFLQYGNIQQLLFDIWLTNLIETSSVSDHDTAVMDVSDSSIASPAAPSSLPQAVNTIQTTVPTQPSAVKKRTREDIEQISISKGAKKGG